MSEVEIDGIVAKMEDAVSQVDAAQGGLVQLPRAELELLTQVEAARNFMMQVLQSENQDRKNLSLIFGGDCVRISRVRAVLESAELQTACTERDLRIRSCLSACESVEKVLGDLGLGFALRLAQAMEKDRMANRASVVAVATAKLPVRAEARQAPSAAQSVLQEEPLAKLRVEAIAAVECPVEPSAELAAAREKPPEEQDMTSQPKSRSPSMELAAVALRNIVGKQNAGAEFHKINCGLEPEAEPSVKMALGLAACAVEDCNSDLLAQHTATAASRCDAEGTRVKSVGSSCTGRADPEEVNRFDAAALPPWLQRLLQKVFTHYAGSDGTTGSGLGLTRFRCFLRDAGILRVLVVGEESTGEAHLERTAVTRRRSCSPQWNEGAKLPLKLFAEPPLTLVQADLIYVQARERQSGLRQSHMSVDAFVLAVADIAHYCGRRGYWASRCMPIDGLEKFCEAVIVPLGELLGLGEEELQFTLSAMSKAEVASLLQRCHRGLEAVFGRYSVGVGNAEPYRRGHWTISQLRRFAIDLDMMGEVSHTSLQRLFDTCTEYDAGQDRSSKGMMSFACFKLAMVMLAHRIKAPTTNLTVVHRVAFFLLRLSVVKGANDLVVPARSVLNTSIKGPRYYQLHSPRGVPRYWH